MATKAKAETPAQETKPKMSLKEKSAAIAAKKGSGKNPTKETTAKTDTAVIKETVAKAVTQVREVKYIYPDGVTTTDQKKKYRQETRNKDKAFIKEIKDLEKAKKDTKKVEASYKKFRKERFLVP